MDGAKNHGLKVVIVRDRASAGGGIHHYYQVLHKHLGVRHEFVDVGRSHCIHRGGRLHALSVPTPLRLLLDWINLVIKLLSFPDVVHLNPGLDIKTRRSLRREAVNLWLAKLFRRRVIVFWRGWDNSACGSPEFPGGNGCLLSKIYRTADAHIVLASDFMNDLRRWGFQGPVFLETTVAEDLIIDGCNATVEERNAGVFRLLFLSRVEAAKGVFELLDALALLNKRNPGAYQLLVAGDGGDLDHLKLRASALGLENVEFAGHVEGEKKLCCFTKAAAFCFLSYTEGMPNAVLEAMAAGLPLVSSSVGGLKDILADGVTGYVIQQNGLDLDGCRFSPEDVACRIEDLAASQDLQRGMALHNREYAARRFAARKVAARLEEIYRAIAQGTPNPGMIAQCESYVASARRNRAEVVKQGDDRHPISADG